MWHSISPVIGWTIIAACGVAMVIAVLLWLTGGKSGALPGSYNVTSHNQKGGVTAHTVNVGDKNA
jgi:hypothetical protein